MRCEVPPGGAPGPSPTHCDRGRHGHPCRESAFRARPRRLDSWRIPVTYQKSHDGIEIPEGRAGPTRTPEREASGPDPPHRAAPSIANRRRFPSAASPSRVPVTTAPGRGRPLFRAPPPGSPRSRHGPWTRHDPDRLPPLPVLVTPKAPYPPARSIPASARRNRRGPPLPGRGGSECRRSSDSPDHFHGGVSNATADRPRLAPTAGRTLDRAHQPRRGTESRPGSRTRPGLRPRTGPPAGRLPGSGRFPCR